MIIGSATKQKTKLFSDNFTSCSPDFYSLDHNNLTLSSIGVGMYKGDNSLAGDKSWEQSLIESIKSGINVFDTAIRYRNQRSEKILGKVLTNLISAKKLKREEVFICTKGGLIGIPVGYIEEEYIQDIVLGKWKIRRNEIYKNIHCLSLSFLKKQFAISLENLNLSTFDCYFLHNPELAIGIKNKKEFYILLKNIFTWLEDEREKGRLNYYGIASWNGFRRRKNSRLFLDIDKIIKIAERVGGVDHGLRYIEAPLSIGMPYLANCSSVSEKINLQNINFINYLNEKGINLFTSASTYEGKIESLLKFIDVYPLIGKKDSKEDDIPTNISLPISENSLIQMMEVIVSQSRIKKNIKKKLFMGVNNGLSLYPAALNIVRSYPGVVCALCGMQEKRYLEENIILMKKRKLNANIAKDIFNSLIIKN